MDDNNWNNWVRKRNEMEVLRRSRLRWLGLVERRDDSNWVRKYNEMEVEG